MEEQKIYTWRIIMTIAGFLLGLVMPYGNASLGFQLSIFSFILGFCIDVIVKRSRWKKSALNSAANHNAIALIHITYIDGLETVKKYSNSIVSMCQDGIHIQSTDSQFIISKEQILEIIHDAKTSKSGKTTYKDILGNYQSYTTSSTSHFLTIYYKSRSGNTTFVLFMGPEMKIKEFISNAGYGKPPQTQEYDSKEDAYRL